MEGVCPGRHLLQIVVFGIVTRITRLAHPFGFLGLGMAGAATPVLFNFVFTFAGVMVAVIAVQTISGLTQVSFVIENYFTGFGLIGNSDGSVRGGDGKCSKTEQPYDQ